MQGRLLTRFGVRQQPNNGSLLQTIYLKSETEWGMLISTSGGIDIPCIYSHVRQSYPTWFGSLRLCPLLVERYELPLFVVFTWNLSKFAWLGSNFKVVSPSKRLKWKLLLLSKLYNVFKPYVNAKKKKKKTETKLYALQIDNEMSKYTGNEFLFIVQSEFTDTRKKERERKKCGMTKHDWWCTSEVCVYVCVCVCAGARARACVRACVLVCGGGCGCPFGVLDLCGFLFLWFVCFNSTVCSLTGRTHVGGLMLNSLFCLLVWNFSRSLAYLQCLSRRLWCNVWFLS